MVVVVVVGIVAVGAIVVVVVVVVEVVVFMLMKALLDDRITQHTIVLFTHGDSLRSMRGKSIHEVIDEAPVEFKQLLADCGNRWKSF